MIYVIVGILVLVGPQAVHIHLLCLCLQRPLVSNNSHHDLAVEVDDCDKGNPKTAPEVHEGEHLVARGYGQVVIGAGQKEAL